MSRMEGPSSSEGGSFNLGLKDGAVWNVGASDATKVASDAGHLAFFRHGFKP